MTTVAPKRKLSTSSERIPSITPIRLRYANSASASPGAWNDCVNTSQRIYADTHGSPLKSKGLYNLLHTWNELIACFVDFLSSLYIWSFWTVKYEYRQKGCPHQSCTSKEESTKDWVFSFFAIFCMEKPDTCVNSQTKPATSIRIGLKPFFNC